MPDESKDADWSRVEGNWSQMQGKLREEWGDLSDEDLAGVKGDRTAMLSLIRERYALGEEEAQRRLLDWEARQRG